MRKAYRACSAGKGESSMAATYWQRTLKQRIGRRRALAGLAGTASAAAFLVACGGDDEDDAAGTSTGSSLSTSQATSSSAASSSLVSDPVDTTKEARRGGVNKWFLTAEPAGFDLHVGGAPKNNPKNLVVSNLVSAKPGYLEQQSYTEYIPDIARSWEWSPDGLTITFKIQQNARWHDKAPVNGRPFDIEDLSFSWQRFVEKGRDRGAVANEVNPDAPVLSFVATDDETAVLTLKEPTSYLLALFAPTTVGKMVIIPKETDSTFDPQTDLIGTGPYVMTEFVPSVKLSFERFPDYYEKDFAFIDKIEAPILLEYAQRMAQFRAGNVYTLEATIRQEDVLIAKRELPELGLFATEPSGFSGAAVNFGFEPGSVFHDERIRQAVSMSWDRDLVIDVLNNVEKLRAEGLPVDTYWATSLSPGSGGWRLDPRDDSFGPNAKYYQHNVEEARKLLAAAGYPDGLEVVSSFIPGPELGDVYTREQTMLDEMVTEAGFKPTPHLIDYVTEYPNYRDANGRYEGWAYVAGPTTADDGVGMLVWRYSKAGGAGYLGFDVGGTGDGSGDPEVDALLNKAKGELDIEARREIVNDVQRYLAAKQYNVTKPGSSTLFTLAWPVLGNYNVFRGDRRTGNYHWWIDDTKPPLKT